jgi:formate-nitrite transporter family protein
VSQGYQAPRLTLPIGSRDHVEGPAEATLVLVEYGDYECPYCGAAYPIVKKVQKRLGSRLRFVFRNFPLTNMHPYAQQAAETAEAAAAQGKFWEMHDFLYENQTSLGDPAVLLRHARKLQLDAAQLEREVAGHVYLPRIEEDYRSGIRSGVNGTPTFFVNSVRYDGYLEFEPLVAALERAGASSAGEQLRAPARMRPPR